MNCFIPNGFMPTAWRERVFWAKLLRSRKETPGAFAVKSERFSEESPTSVKNFPVFRRGGEKMKPARIHFVSAKTQNCAQLYSLFFYFG